VRHRAQQRGLDHVRAAQGLRLDHLCLQPVTVERGPQQRLERGRHARANPCPHRLAGARSQDEERLAAAAQVKPDTARTDRFAGGIEHDHDVAQTKRSPNQAARLRQRIGKRCAAEQGTRGVGGQVGLSAPSLGLRRSRTRKIRDRRRHRRRRRDKKHSERDPMRRVGDHQTSGGCDVKEVEGRGARHARQQAERQSPVHGHQQNREEIDDARRHLRRDLAQRIDQQRRRRDRERGVQQPQRAGPRSIDQSLRFKGGARGT